MKAGTMKTKRFRDLMKKTMSAGEIAEAERRARAELLEMSLREMRELAGKTQVEMAGDLEKAQSEISALERRDDYLLSTLKKYVEALGGELKVIAEFGDRSVRLRGV
jgi:transcriptional regulator with XRE-family HTH domain